MSQQSSARCLVFALVTSSRVLFVEPLLTKQFATINEDLARDKAARIGKACRSACYDEHAHSSWVGSKCRWTHCHECPECKQLIESVNQEAMTHEGLTSMSSSLPTEPGCFVMLPSGCPRRKFAAPTWTKDPNEVKLNSNSSFTACESRRIQYNKWCGVGDTIMHFNSEVRDAEMRPAKVKQANRAKAPASEFSPLSLPSEPGCYVLLLTGCPKRLWKFEGLGWTKDPDADKLKANTDVAVCESRRMHYNRWCGVVDAKMHFVEQDMKKPPEGVKELFEEPKPAEVVAEEDMERLPAIVKETLEEQEHAEVVAEEDMERHPVVFKEALEEQEPAGVIWMLRNKKVAEEVQKPTANWKLVTQLGRTSLSHAIWSPVWIGEILSSFWSWLTGDAGDAAPRKPPRKDELTRQRDISKKLDMEEGDGSERSQQDLSAETEDVKAFSQNHKAHENTADGSLTSTASQKNQRPEKWQRYLQTVPWWEYKTNRTEDCPPLMVFVMSSRPNKERRMAIRQMWTDEGSWGLVQARFAVCKHPAKDESEEVSAQLQEETQSHDDMTWLDCKEGYLNGLLTEKVFHSMKTFLQDNWKPYEMFMKTDDDTFVSLSRTCDYLSSQPARKNNFKHAYIGVFAEAGEKVMVQRPPCRNPNSSWYEPYSKYGEKLYPVSAKGGPGYIMSRHMVEALITDRIAEENILNNEDKAAGVWVDKLIKKGMKIEYINMPGTDGYEEYHPGHIARTGEWKKYPYAIHHHLTGSEIVCLHNVERDGNADQTVNQCFDAGIQDLVETRNDFLYARPQSAVLRALSGNGEDEHETEINDHSVDDIAQAVASMSEEEQSCLGVF